MDSLTPDELRTVARSVMQAFGERPEDVDTLLLAGRAVIEAALGLTHTHPEQANDYRSVALPHSYNLSAACWPCWEETVSPHISPAVINTGLDLARFNVELAERMAVGPEKQKNGQWILGAHLLIQRDFINARVAFQKAERYGREAGDADAELMAAGWLLLVAAYQGNPDADQQLDVLKKRLAAQSEDGAFYAAQYDPVRHYLGSPSGA